MERPARTPFEELLENGFSLADIEKYPPGLAYERLQTYPSENQALIALGVYHTNDPESGLFAEIDAVFQELVEYDTEAFVIAEGGVWKRFKSDDRETNIRRGEQQYAASSARSLGIEVVSGEPGMDAEIAEVLNELGDTQEAWHALADYYAMRMGPQLFRGNVPQEEAGQVFNQQLERLRDTYIILRQVGETNVGAVDFSEKAFRQRFMDSYEMDPVMELASVKTMFDETVGHMMLPLEERDIEQEDESAVVRVSRVINTLRDRSLMERIQYYIEEGKSVFTIYGIAHIDAIRDQLQALDHHPEQIDQEVTYKNAPAKPVHPYQQLIPQH